MLFEQILNSSPMGVFSRDYSIIAVQYYRIYQFSFPTGELSLPILEQLCKKEESGSARMQVTSIRERELQRGKDARIKIRPRCGQCIGCLQEVNCGECTSCR